MNGETWLQELARKKREGVVQQPTATVAQPKSEVVAQLKEVVRVVQRDANGPSGKLRKRDAKWWQEYRKKPKLCPHCGKDMKEKP